MLSKREWLFFVLLPVAAVVVLDLWTKGWAAQALPREFGWLRLTYLENPGFMLGSMSGASKLFTVVVPATLGALLVCLYLVLQYFLPIRSRGMRAGIAVMLGGVLGNLLDRAQFGFVRDFLLVTTPWFQTGVFNLADAMQWFGLASFIASYVRNGRLLYPVEERRGRKWIDPRFQLRYCLTLVATGTGFSLTAGVLSATFMDLALGDASRSSRDLWVTYAVVYGSATVLFLVALSVVGILMSHRIVGPVRSFERFLDEAMQGKSRAFQLRRHDEFRQLEGLATRFQDMVNGRIGLTAAPLQAGMPAPSFTAETKDGVRIALEDFKGQKVWLIFYRYATCPLCAIHLKGARDLLLKAQASGMAVLLVYESSPQDFTANAGGTTSELLKSLAVPQLADPERILYRRFRTELRLAAFLRPALIPVLARAWLEGFRQGAVKGAVAQLPAHFIVDEHGQLELAHYARSFEDHLAPEVVERFIAKASAPRAG